MNAIGTTYKVKAGQYSNTVTATGVDQATNVKVTATDTNYHFGVASGPQLAAAAPSGAPLGVTSLTQAELAPIVAEAVARWSVITGLPVDVLSQIPVEIADLPDGGHGLAPILGYTSDAVQIDVNAGGFGWFIDPTPSDDVEFRFTDSTGSLMASPTSLAAGGIDLLTVVMHEFGHVLGLDDVDNAVRPGDLMD